MGKDSKKKPARSRADLLIEEAVKALEKHEDVARPKKKDSEKKEKLAAIDVDDTDLTEIEEIKTHSTGERAIAKVDLHQYIDKETYLRVLADFENFRRRSGKERAESERVGQEKVLREFLEILDNLERGLNQAKGDESPLAAGMRMILSQAEMWLKAQGLERITSIGYMFDPALHEAISQREDASQSSGIILEEVKRGYRWWDRLLRPAAVVVCKNDEVINDSELE